MGELEDYMEDEDNNYEHHDRIVTEFSQEDFEEGLEDDSSKKQQSGKKTTLHTKVEEKKDDFVKDTFAKFGLNMNLYNPNTKSESKYMNDSSNANRDDDGSKNKVNPKVRKILDIMPDYGFLLDTKLALPQTFFMES